MAKPSSKSPHSALFAAGCFWHVQNVFSNIPGVIDSTVGYSGGNTKNPSYDKVSLGNTGHAESVLIRFNPSKVSYKELLNHFFMIHNPTTQNRQGPDIGTNYRSAVFYFTNQQKKEAEEIKKEAQKKFDKKIVTEIKKAGKFYPAEDYHQKYFEKHGEGSCLMVI